MKMRKGAIAAAAATAAIAAATAAEAKNWGPWSAPVSIDQLPGASAQLNTAFVDGCPSLSPDGLALYFTSNRPGGQGGVDIWVARRSSISTGFGEATNLGAPVNSAGNESCATFTPSGRLYFTSVRDDPRGDLYVARQGKNGWTVERLGPNVNSPDGIDEAPSFHEDEQGRTVMYFSSSRSGRNQVYYSVDFGPAQLANGVVNSNVDSDARPGVRKDGLEIFWDSTRYGGGGGTDFWTATRSSTSAQWGQAVHLQSLSGPGPSTFFGPGFDARPFVSRDGSIMVFGSNRAGGLGLVDLYYTTRQKLTGGN